MRHTNTGCRNEVLTLAEIRLTGWWLFWLALWRLVQSPALAGVDSRIHALFTYYGCRVHMLLLAHADLVESVHWHGIGC